ncbi:MAG: hypothetical protein KDD25_02075 [Bdellovibrionales bacterium]|nr:hypothetical protein [Bdellovibrionales bacterium]
MSCGTQRTKPTVPEIVDSKDDVKGSQKTLPKIGMILGPGGLRAFGHLGVLREFERAQIPIHSIAGIEWGSLVAGLYAHKSKSHDVEWKLQKLKSDHIPQKTLFNSKINPANLEKINEFLKTVFDDKGRGAIEFGCSTINKNSGAIRWLSGNGSIDQVKQCLPFPPIFQSRGGWASYASDLSGVAQKLKDGGADVIVYVNVIGDANWSQMKSMENNETEQLLWWEVQKHLASQFNTVDWVVNVSLGNADVLDFDRRKSFVLTGQQAGLYVAKKITSKYGF